MTVSISPIIVRLDVTSEEGIAKTYKEELEVKLREICAIMNTARDDGFQTDFKIAPDKRGSYQFDSIKLTKSY